MIWNLNIDTGFIETYDGATIETIQLTPSIELLKPTDKQHFIIKFLGNRMLYNESTLINSPMMLGKLNETVIKSVSLSRRR